MKRFVIILTVLWLAAMSYTAIALATQSPIKTVERLAYQRDSAAGDKLVKVQCGVTKRAYTYICAFIGKKKCAITYVHYNPNNPSYGKPYKVNFWGVSWPCTTQPPMAPPQYPGDGGPGA